MSHTDKLLKNTIIYTIGNLGSKLLSFLLVPIYSFYLTKSDLGHFDLIVTSISLFVPFITLQISDACYRWLLEAKERHNEQATAISNGVLVVLTNSLIFFVLYLIASVLLKINYTTQIFFILFWSCLYQFLTQSIRGLGKNKLYSLIGLINTVLIVGCNLGFMLFSSMNLESLLYSLLLSTSISTLIAFQWGGIRKYIKAHLISKHEIKTMLRYSWPLIPNTISWWMINEVNRFIILFSIGASANGIFAIANKFPSLLIILNSIFMLSWQDMAIENKDDEDRHDTFSKVFNTFVTLELTVAIFLISMSKFMAANFVGADFYESWKYMPILYLSVAFSAFAGLLGVGYLGAKKTNSLFTTTIFGSVINIITCYLLIDEIGLYAPAIGALLGFSFIFLLRKRQTNAYFELKIDYGKYALLLVVAAVYIKLVHYENLYLQVGLILTSCLICTYFNRDLLKSLTSYARTKIK